MSTAPACYAIAVWSGVFVVLWMVKVALVFLALMYRFEHWRLMVVVLVILIVVGPVAGITLVYVLTPSECFG